MRIFNITQGLFVRLLFTISSIIAVWRVASTTEQDIYWLLMFFNVLLYVEAIITFTQRKSGEWKWTRLNTIPSTSKQPEKSLSEQCRFCPSVFIYLMMTVPCTWVLELNLLADRKLVSDANNISCVASEDIFGNPDELEDFEIKGIEINIPLSLQPHMWSLALQQVLLFVLIIGRWLLPKGDLTRDQLSQLLLVYIGIAADILEFSTEGLKMKETRCNRLMCVCILGIWTWSLMQFTLGLTVTKSRKPRVASSRDMEPRMNILCCETEVWGILATVVMQDGPFLALRLYIVVVYEAINQMMIFFTCKNMLVVLLQFYRLLVVFIEKPNRDPHSIMGRIQRYRHPGSRYHAGEHLRGMPMERDASTTKLLSIDPEAAASGLPLIPPDHLTADGRLRHSVNMANPDEMFSHTPMLPERFPGNNTAFVIGKALPTDLPIVQLPDELDMCDSPTHSNSDYENLHTPYGSVPNENGDIERRFMIPDFPDLPSVYDSDEEAAKRESRMLEEQDEDDTGTDGNKKKGKKRTKEEIKKEKEEKKKQKEELKKQKEEMKKKEKEDKKKMLEELKKQKEEQKKEEKRKEGERRQSKKESKRESKKELKRKGSILSLVSLDGGQKHKPISEDNTIEDQIKEDETVDNHVPVEKVQNTEEQKEQKNTEKKQKEKTNTSNIEKEQKENTNIKKEQKEPTNIENTKEQNNTENTANIPKQSSTVNATNEVPEPTSPPHSPPKSPPKSPVLVSFEDM